jgi:transcriptional accessory protein Tex/SPT6
MSADYVRDANDLVKLGDTVHVRVTEIDSMGRINLTMLTPEQEAAAKENGGGERRGGGGSGGFGGGSRGGFDRGPRRTATVEDRGGDRGGDFGFRSRRPR